MVSYHSKFNDKAPADQACGFALHTITPKASYDANDVNSHDIVDEAIQLFRANILFKNYKVQGNADKVTIFLTCFIQKCLDSIVRYPAKEQAERIFALVKDDPKAIAFTESSHFLNKLGLLNPNSSVAEKRKLVDYMKKAMEETAKRLHEYLFREGEGDLNRKFWVGLAKGKPFLGQKFTDKQYTL